MVDCDSLYPIYVCTSHFESSCSDNEIENRKNQLYDTFVNILKNEPNCVVAGDFNFDNAEEHKVNITDNNFEDIILSKFQSDKSIEKKE